MLSNIELLDVELGVLWARDPRGRLSAPPRGSVAPYVVLAVARDGLRLAFSREVPDNVVATVTEIAERDRPPFDPSREPACVQRCAEVVQSAMGNAQLTCGPSYLVPHGIAFASAVPVVTLASARGTAELRPPTDGSWESDEWTDLVRGKLGPWAMAVEDGEVVSICHSARLTDRGAEAGVRSDAGHRGRGLAAAVTAAWAAQFEPGRSFLFYSTSSENGSSQRVAARLGLQELGWTWRLMPAELA